MSIVEDKKTSQLEYLTQDRVREIRNDFRLNIANNVGKVVTKNTQKAKIKLLKKYSVIRAIGRVIVGTEALKSMLSITDKEIKALSRQFVEPYFSKEQRRAIRKSAQKRYKKYQRGLLGTKNRRLYFPLKSNQDSSDIESSVSAYLNIKEHFILNYNAGYATDVTRKQTYKIGKLIKDNEVLYKKFITDTSRSVDKQYLVLSDYANDIAYMSTRRGWTSCMSHDGVFKTRPLADI